MSPAGGALAASPALFPSRNLNETLVRVLETSGSRSRAVGSRGKVARERSGRPAGATQRLGHRELPSERLREWVSTGQRSGSRFRSLSGVGLGLHRVAFWLSRTDVSGWRLRGQKQGTHESPGKRARSPEDVHASPPPGGAARPAPGRPPATRGSRRGGGRSSRLALLCGSGRK